MIPALIAAILFAASVIAASRSSRLLGTKAANFWRILVAAILLGIWAHTVGQGLGGGAFGIFFLSGVIGFGLGDYGLFEALPRLGPRLVSLMVNCLAAPFAAAIEWAWLDTRLTGLQLLFGVVILGGVALSIAPEESSPKRSGATAGGSRGKEPSPALRAPSPVGRERDGVRGSARGVWGVGIAFGLLAGFGQGFGAVLTRKAFGVAKAGGFEMDGGTAAYQRILGGLAFVTIPYLWWVARQRWRANGVRPRLTPDQARRAWAWVGANALAGPAVGVAFYQWALKIAPSGIVLPVTAMAPLLVVPFTYVFEGDRPTTRSLVGGVLAVAGVIGLALCR